MGRMCAVLNCTSQYDKKEFVSLHKFPNDKDLFEQWYKVCKHKNKTRNLYMCSLHFEESCFDFHLNNTTVKLFLKPGSVPTLNLPSPITDNHLRNFRPVKYMLESNEKYNSDECIDECDLSEVTSCLNGTTKCDIAVQCSNEIQIKEEMDLFTTTHSNQDSKYEKLLKENKRLKGDLKSAVKKLRKVESANCRNGISSRNHAKKKCDDTQWEEDDILKAVQLRNISDEAYQYCVQVLKMNLPSESFLRNWESNKIFVADVTIKKEEKEDANLRCEKQNSDCNDFSRIRIKQERDTDVDMT